MVLSAKGRYTYIPKFDGNRLLPEREQVTVEIIRPRVEERNQLKSLSFSRDSDAAAFETPRAGGPLSMTPHFRTGQILRCHIGGIKNLSVEENGKTRVIANGVELAECTAFGVELFVQELTAEVLSDHLTEDEKKSTPPLLSSPAKDGEGKVGTGHTMKSGKSSVSDTLSAGNSGTT